MKKTALILFLLCLMPLFGTAETLGFGFVNADKVNVRESPNGKILLRLDEGHEVYITDTKTDGKGKTWYRVNTYLHYNYGHYEKIGWVRGDLVMAGEEYWRNISDIASDGENLIALTKDGHVLGAGTPSHSEDNDLAQWKAGLSGVKGIATAFHTYFALMEDGTVRGAGIRLPQDNKNIPVRLISSGSGGRPVRVGKDGRLYAPQEYRWLNTDEQTARAAAAQARGLYADGAFMALLTEDGRVLAARNDEDGFRNFAYPDFNEWKDVSDFALRSWWGEDYDKSGEIFIAVHKDGTVSAFPESVQKAVGAWRDVIEVRVAEGFALALKKDGTCLTAALSPDRSYRGNAQPDVSAWRGIQKITVLSDAAVGLTTEGTLVFAGNHRMWIPLP